MKTLSTLKTLPLIGLLAMGLTLAPAVSLAGDDDRGRDRVYQKHDGGKGKYRDHDRSHRRDYGHKKHGQSHKKSHKKSHKHGGNKHVYKSHRKHGDKHAYSSHRKHGHKHGGYTRHDHGHRHVNHGHRHVDTVVVRDHHYDYDPFRLMLGLHFDNIDIIYRDF